ncbi:methionyl-tRNA formyltransferase [Glaciecola petra]|uniref:Methionyl-tRNA formyltransferase n=1 Tax=Glaciecola petra TaxID=3075602 RepID=A0ABU2ZQB1_9ALTE|nr:methionyl-tRNA formyltransferase [Aestuariibacter sp. P117]MDT0594790.1 methionyl-tRNA formyltransferase [Aestuariibacter sp. P117]
MRILFAGTPDFAAAHLQALIDAEFEIIGVYTQPDRPAGRGKKLNQSAVKKLAIANNLPIFQPPSLKDQQVQAELADLAPDIMVVVAYGLILPKAILDIPSKACINVHGSILPKWRGAAPIQRSIWAGDEKTGVSIMHMDEGLDTGDVIHIASIPIENDDTSASLYQKLAHLGPKTLVHCLQNWHSFGRQKQEDSKATYAKKLSKQEAYLNWQMPAQQLQRNVRAFDPWPVAWFEYKGKAFKVWQARDETIEAGQQSRMTPGEIIKFDKTGLFIATIENVLVIDKLQIPGKKPQRIIDLVNGQAELFEVGDIIE